MFPFSWRLRTLLRVWAFGLLAVGIMLLTASCGIVLADDPPNIILIVSDDSGYADFGFMDSLTGQTTEFKTPNIDQLASESVVFSQGYVTSSVCSVTRAGLLSGRYQNRFGFELQIHSSIASETNGMPTDQVMMAERLKQLGYSTGVVGKWHLGMDEPRLPNNRGFDYFFGLLGGSRHYFGTFTTPAERIMRDGSPADWVNEPSFNGIEPDPVLGRELTDAFGDEASQFIANHAGGDNPFFLYLPFTATHGPYYLAKEADIREFDDTSLTGERKNVAAITYALDRAIGNIVGRLQDPNGDGDTSDSIDDNTIIAFVNDNGGRGTFSTGFPSEWHDNTPLKGVKATYFEGGIRVPFFLRMPGVEPGIFNQAVNSLDLMPTFVNAAGGQLDFPTDGVDLAPYLEGTQSGAVHDYLFWRYMHLGFAVNDGQWKLTKGYIDEISLYHLNPDGSGEDVDLKFQIPG